jgi:RimJ/RimL family protein N-acetyltransferase
MLKLPGKSSVQIFEITRENVDLGIYISWLRNAKDNEFIEGARADYSFSELQTYIESKVNRPNVRFWGISLDSKKFIGTIKLEPIDWDDKVAWLGMMIGDSSERGKGYGYQALKLVLDYAAEVLLLRGVFLGVHKNNIPALSIYSKSGFEIWKVNNFQIIMKKEFKT